MTTSSGADEDTSLKNVSGVMTVSSIADGDTSNKNNDNQSLTDVLIAPFLKRMYSFLPLNLIILNTMSQVFSIAKAIGTANFDCDAGFSCNYGKPACQSVCDTTSDPAFQSMLALWIMIYAFTSQ